MKKIKILISAFAVVAVVSSALAFNESNYFANGTVWCNDSNCTANQQVAFKVDPSGTITVPCGPGGQPYIISSCGGSIVCAATPSGTKFEPTTDQ